MNIVNGWIQPQIYGQCPLEEYNWNWRKKKYSNLPRLNSTFFHRFESMTSALGSDSSEYCLAVIERIPDLQSHVRLRRNERDKGKPIDNVNTSSRNHNIFNLEPHDRIILAIILHASLSTLLNKINSSSKCDFSKFNYKFEATKRANFSHCSALFSAHSRHCLLAWHVLKHTMNNYLRSTLVT